MKKRKQTHRIIYHHSLSDLSTVDNIRRYHMDHHGWSDIGYHFVVELDGQIEHGRAVTLVGAHAFGRNRDSIGVCIVGNLHDHEPTMNQIYSCQRIYHDVCRAYSKSLRIEMHRPHVFNLFEPASYGRFNSCPGSKMDRADFWEIVKRGDPFGPKKTW